MKTKANMGLTSGFLTSDFRPLTSSLKRKERESNSQGSSLGRFRDGCRRPSACPSVTSCGSSNRTCHRLNKEPPYDRATAQFRGQKSESEVRKRRTADL